MKIIFIICSSIIFSSICFSSHVDQISALSSQDNRSAHLQCDASSGYAHKIINTQRQTLFLALNVRADAAKNTPHDHYSGSFQAIDAHNIWHHADLSSENAQKLYNLIVQNVSHAQLFQTADSLNLLQKQNEEKKEQSPKVTQRIKSAAHPSFRHTSQSCSRKKLTTVSV